MVPNIYCCGAGTAVDIEANEKIMRKTETRSIHMLSVFTNMNSGIIERHHGQNDALHNPSQPFKRRGGKKKKSNNNVSFGPGSDSGSTPLVDATGNIHMGTGSVNNLRNGGNGDGDSENVGQTCPNSGLNLPLPLQETTSVGNAPSKSSYANVTGKRVAYPVVANYVRNTWGKYRLVRSMFRSSTGLFSFQFSSMEGLNSMLENGPCEDGLSVIATKLGTPLMLDSYTSDMCMQSWGMSSYARAMIKLRADVELKDNIIAAMPKITREGYYTCAGETKNIKKTSQTPKGILVGQKIGFKPKQVYQPVSKKPTANTSVNKKKNVEQTKEVSKSNPFEVLTSVEIDVELGTNGGTSNLARQATNSSGSSFWNVDASSPSTTPVIEKINKIKKLIIEGKVTLVDDHGKPLEKVASSGDYDSEDEVASVDNDMAKFLAKEDGYGTQSFLEQWTESYKNGDYRFDLYDDDMYECQDIPKKLQAICDNLDITVRGRRKK
ncbi:hypothetical protein Tco_0487985 [Tanacetum coccineum]